MDVGRRPRAFTVATPAVPLVVGWRSVMGVAVGTAVGVGVVLAAPEWVPHSLTREDGPVEILGFTCFAVGSLLALVAAWRARPDRRALLGAGALALVLFVAAGEEISWGQRILDVDTPAALVDGNRQDELNLHNIDGLQDKAVLAQLAVALVGVLLPRFDGGRWARAGVPFFAGYLAYRGGRGVAALLDLGPADRQSEAAELLLAAGLLVVSTALVGEVQRRRNDRSAPRLPERRPDPAAA